MKDILYSDRKTNDFVTKANGNPNIFENVYYVFTINGGGVTLTNKSEIQVKLEDSSDSTSRFTIPESDYELSAVKIAFLFLLCLYII